MLNKNLKRKKNIVERTLTHCMCWAPLTQQIHIKLIFKGYFNINNDQDKSCGYNKKREEDVKFEAEMNLLSF